MALFKLGRRQEAQITFERLEELMNDEEEGLRLYSETAVGWYAECKQLLAPSDPHSEPLENTEEGRN
jgi:hypothetical protein